jgi:acetyl-CoA carboxylase carboxyl transferase subunit beta
MTKKKIPFVSVLTDPTTGGVSASFAMLGDIIIAEKGATIGFAGSRVIEETIKEKLPQDFQKSEYLKQKGMIDIVVHRKDLKSTLSKIVKHLSSNLK